MPISEKKFQQLFEEAQADAIRFRQERDAAFEERCEKLHQMRCALECSERDLAEARRRIGELERAAERLATPRPAEEWHEDMSAVLWWHFPIQEPPEVGYGPGLGELRADGERTDCARGLDSGWLTHWTPLPDNREIQRRFDLAQGDEKDGRAVGRTF